MGDSLHKDPLRSYKALVARRAQIDSHLQSLDEFLQGGSVGYRSCRIVCLEFSCTSDPPHRQNLDLDGLKLTLNHQSDRGKNSIGRLLVIEDITSEVIDTLGSSLDIDPFFFASHIDTFEADITKTRPSMATVPSTSRTHNFLNLHYHRIIKFEGLEPGTQLLRDMNIPRKIGILPGFKGTDIGLIKHCCSIIRIEGKAGLWLGMQHSSH